MDTSYRVIHAAGEMADFCACVQSNPDGLARCNACDEMAARSVGADTRYRIYRCHAGLYDVFIAHRRDGAVITHISASDSCGQHPAHGGAVARHAETLGWNRSAAALEEPYKHLDHTRWSQ